MSWPYHNKKKNLQNHDSVTWEFCSDLFHKLDEMLRVAIGNVEADVIHLRHQFQYHLQFLKITSSYSRAHRHILQPHPGNYPLKLWKTFLGAAFSYSYAAVLT